MKILIFLVLAGVSLAAGLSNGKEYANVTAPKTLKSCVEYAFEHTANYLPKFQKFLCDYTGDLKENEENYKNKAKDFVGALTNAGCTLGQIFGREETFETLGRDLGLFVEVMGRAVIVIADELKISKPLAQFLCNMSVDPLAEECVKKTIKNGSKVALEKMDFLVCKASKAGNHHATIVTMKELNCLGDPILHIKDAMEKCLEQNEMNLGGIMKSLLDTLKKLVAGLSIVSNLTCKLFTRGLFKELTDMLN